MIKINSRLHKLEVDKINSIVENTVLWCQDNFGVNNRRKNPFMVKVDTFSFDAMGQFNYKTNEITVFTWLHSNPGSLVSTIIHEYTHYLQPIRSKYNKLAKIYKHYDKHPMEKEAYKTEKKYFKKCWSEIRNKI